LDDIRGMRGLRVLRREGEGEGGRGGREREGNGALVVDGEVGPGG
jgi:hypothetical protein